MRTTLLRGGHYTWLARVDFSLSWTQYGLVFKRTAITAGARLNCSCLDILELSHKWTTRRSRRGFPHLTQFFTNCNWSVLVEWHFCSEHSFMDLKCYSTLHCTTVQDATLHYTTLHDMTTHSSTPRYITLQHATPPNPTLRYST